MKKCPGNASATVQPLGCYGGLGGVASPGPTEPYMKDETSISSRRNKIKTLHRQNGQEKGKH